jgi:hypothetical protein
LLPRSICSKLGCAWKAPFLTIPENNPFGKIRFGAPKGLPILLVARERTRRDFGPFREELGMEMRLFLPKNNS